MKQRTRVVGGSSTPTAAGDDAGGNSSSNKPKPGADDFFRSMLKWREDGSCLDGWKEAALFSDAHLEPRHLLRVHDLILNAIAGTAQVGG